LGGRKLGFGSVVCLRRWDVGRRTIGEHG